MAVRYYANSSGPPNSMNRISFCIITLNEEHNLPRALASLHGVADEIVVVDSGSSDGTEEAAKKFGVRFAFRTWTNYAEQKNAAIEYASNQWIFSMDADEELSEALKSSLLEWKKREPE